MPYRSVEIKGDRVFLINQTLLPTKLETIEIKTLEEMFNAIKTMVVRGAPAIGIAAAGGMGLFIKSQNEFNLNSLMAAGGYLKQSRPTAVNLAWAVDEVIDYCREHQNDPNLQKNVWQFIKKLDNENEQMNRDMAKHGADLIESGKKINALTHCNAGSIATAFWGTALGVINELHERKQINMVYADETRPRLQGGKLTAWELMEDGIPVTVITDNMAAYMMKQGKIDAVFVGADRIAVNGDTANKIGTYNVAIIANYHHIPFYIVAPTSTIDLNIPNGHAIPIEERDAREVTHINEQAIFHKGGKVINPAFDVTPAKLITGIVTEKGVAL